MKLTNNSKKDALPLGKNLTLKPGESAEVSAKDFDPKSPIHAAWIKAGILTVEADVKAPAKIGGSTPSVIGPKV